MPLKILIVEDDPATLELMAEVLADLEAEAHPCLDSSEAVMRVTTERFDGIFLDLMMPKIDGFGLARAIRRSRWNSTCPIVIVTADEGRNTMSDAFAAGGTFYLRKPINRKRLKALLDSTRGSMLDNRRGFMRVPLSVPVSCKMPFGSTSAVASNISVRGMLLIMKEPVTLGQELQATFYFPGQLTPIAVQANVTRQYESGGAGVSFTHLKRAVRERIRDYVTDLAPAKQSFA
jgi:CheY-like chemotaxis protein